MGCKDSICYFIILRSKFIMKAYLKIYAITLIAALYFAPANIKAQDSIPGYDFVTVVPPKVRSKHSLNLESFGRSFLFGSLSYEYSINRSFSAGIGLGLAYVGAGEILRSNNGEPESGRYFETASSQMIYGMYFLGPNRHRLLLTAGLTNFLTTDRYSYPSEVHRSADAQIEWNAGLGYQFLWPRVNLRLIGYVISLPDPHGWFPKYMPWAGLTVGYKI